MSHATQAPIAPGQVLAGKYRVERVLGVGGMGCVVAATHLQLDERVAIKFLLPEVAQNGEAVARFAREARAAVKIKSEHVGRVIDVGSLETGSPYMVMEYLQGSDLSDLVRNEGALAVPRAVEFVLQACEALAEAHSYGIVHRDLKPANLFLIRRPDGSPCIKVLDFGISKTTGSGSKSDMGMTKTTAVMGSPLYMSPEQLTASRHVDVRTDIWAMGVVLYELVTGRLPFEADTMPELCGMILAVPPSPPRAFQPGVPPALESVVLRCLEKDRNLRFANVAELAVALAPFAGGDGGRSVERIARVLGASGLGSPAPVESAAAVARSAASGGRPTQAAWADPSSIDHATGGSSPRGGRWIVMALLALAAVGGAAATYLVLQKPAEDAGATPAAPAIAPNPVPPNPAPPPALEPTPAKNLEPSSNTPSVIPSVIPETAAAPPPPVAASAPAAASVVRPGSRPQPPRRPVTARPAARAPDAPAAPASPPATPAPYNPLEDRR